MGSRGTAVSLCALLAACGGGGSGNTPASPATPAPTAVPGQLWSDVAPLRDAAVTCGRLVGAAFFSSRLGSDASYTGAAGRHFNYVTAEWEMKWDPIQRVQGVYDFSGGDRIVAFAESRGMRVKGHALVWHGATPAWVDALSPPELRIAFEDHIRDGGLALPGPRLGLGRRERGDRRRAARAAQHGVLPRAGGRLRRRGVPLGSPGRSRGAARLQRLRRRGAEPQVERRVRAGARPQAARARGRRRAADARLGHEPAAGGRHRREHPAPGRARACR